ncbi:MAG: AAA family ATPase [Prochloraceae cyanobacterium]
MNSLNSTSNVPTLICHLLIGPPASGKSTFGFELAKHLGATVISTDSIRGELYGDAAYQGQWKEIESSVLQKITIAVEQKIPIVYDATNAKRPWRISLLGQLEDLNAHWVGWQMTTPVTVCKQRNKKRVRQVPEETIEEMVAELKAFPPHKAEGFIAIEKVDFQKEHFDFDRIMSRVEQIQAGLPHKFSLLRTSSQTLHRYSQLTDFERLMHLIALLSSLPRLGHLGRDQLPDAIESKTCVEEISRLMAERFDPLYADTVKLKADIVWLQVNGLIGYWEDFDAPLTGIEPEKNKKDFFQHRYSSVEPFSRLLKLIRWLVFNPFFPDDNLKNYAHGRLDPPENYQLKMLEILTLMLLEEGIIETSPKYASRTLYNQNKAAYDNIRRDFQMVLKPYKLLPQFTMRKGYYIGTSILSPDDLNPVFNLLREQYPHFSDDPIALATYQTFEQRLEESKLLKNTVPYPTRIIGNRSIVSPRYQHEKSLLRNLTKVETAIEYGELLELDRLKHQGKHSYDQEGLLYVYPLQLVFFQIAWYLGVEVVGGKKDGLLRFVRLDRLVWVGEAGKRRSREAQQDAFGRLRRLFGASAGLFLGNTPQEQTGFLLEEQQHEFVEILELWANDEAFSFISEGTERFAKMKFSKPLQESFQVKSERNLFELPPTGDAEYPHRVQIELPRWSFYDVELLRWILGFREKVIVKAPESFRQEVKKSILTLAQRY